MKSLKALVLSSVAMLTIGVATVSAQTEIRLSGSTAFRGATNQAILNILQAGRTYGYTGTTLNGSDQAIFKGTTVGGTSVTIKTSWAGSQGGIQCLVQNPRINAPGKFIVTNPSVALTTGGTASIPLTDVTVVAQANLAMSDTFQSSSRFSGAGFDNAVDTVVGVIPFAWVKGGGTTANTDFPNLTNVSQQQAISLLNGGLLLSEFTGNSADAGTVVVCVGRDADSGTRAAAFAEPHFGIQSVCQQYYPNGANPSPTDVNAQSGGSGSVTSLNLWPAQVVLGKSYGLGENGFYSGSRVAAVLNRQIDTGAIDPNFGAPFAIVGYLGIGDANSVNSGSNKLTYNGVAIETSPPYTSIIQGHYSFWTYEHIMRRSDATATETSVYTELANRIKNFDAGFGGNGILLGDMQVHRGAEGSEIIPGPL